MSSVVDVIVAKICPLRETRSPQSVLSRSTLFSSDSPSSSSSSGGLRLLGAAKARGAPNGQYIVQVCVTAEQRKCILCPIKAERKELPLNYGRQSLQSYTLREFDSNIKVVEALRPFAIGIMLNYSTSSSSVRGQDGRQSIFNIVSFSKDHLLDSDQRP